MAPRLGQVDAEEGGKKRGTLTRRVDMEKASAHQIL